MRAPSFRQDEAGIGVSRHQRHGYLHPIIIHGADSEIIDSGNLTAEGVVTSIDCSPRHSIPVPLMGTIMAVTTTPMYVGSGSTIRC